MGGGFDAAPLTRRVTDLKSELQAEGRKRQFFLDHMGKSYDELIGSSAVIARVKAQMSQAMDAVLQDIRQKVGGRRSRKERILSRLLVLFRNDDFGLAASEAQTLWQQFIYVASIHRAENKVGATHSENLFYQKLMEDRLVRLVFEHPEAPQNLAQLCRTQEGDQRVARADKHEVYEWYGLGRKGSGAEPVVPSAVALPRLPANRLAFVFMHLVIRSLRSRVGEEDAKLRKLLTFYNSGRKTPNTDHAEALKTFVTQVLCHRVSQGNRITRSGAQCLRELNKLRFRSLRGVFGDEGRHLGENTLLENLGLQRAGLAAGA